MKDIEASLEGTKPPGGGSKVWSFAGHGPAALSFADFFSAARDFGLSNAIKEIKSRVISKADAAARLPNARFIFPTPGGRSKVWRLSIADRWVRHANYFAKLRKHFFWRSAATAACA